MKLNLLVSISWMAIMWIGCADRTIRPLASTSDTENEKGFDDGYTRNTSRNSASSATEVKALGNLTLDNYLRRVPGVNVQGDGPAASITIRGISSILSGLSPLFILNNSAMEGGYSAVYSMVNPHDIKSVSVLKDPASIGIYGTRGANGVIVISLKKQNLAK